MLIPRTSLYVLLRTEFWKTTAKMSMDLLNIFKHVSVCHSANWRPIFAILRSYTNIDARYRSLLKFFKFEHGKYGKNHDALYKTTMGKTAIQEREVPRTSWPIRKYIEARADLLTGLRSIWLASGNVLPRMPYTYVQSSKTWRCTKRHYAMDS